MTLGPCATLRILMLTCLLATPALAVRPSAKHRIDPRQVAVPFEPVSFPAARDSAELSGWWFPAGDSAAVALLCSHSSGSMADLLPSVKEFHRRGFSVLTFDYRDFGPGGVGETDSLNHVVFASRWVDDTEGAMRYARRRAPGRAVLAWGHDIGGASAVAAAARDRRLVDALVVGNLFTTSQDLLYQNGTSQIPGVPERQRALVRGADEPISAVPMLHTPMLVILAGRDSQWPIEKTRPVVQRSLSRIDRWSLPDAGHEGVEATPGYYDRIANWFKGILPYLRPPAGL